MSSGKTRPRIEESTVEQIDALLQKMDRRPEYMTFQHKIQIVVDKAEAKVSEENLMGESF